MKTNNANGKPLVSYYGGKQRMASKILPIIQRIPHTVYAEPFAGGAAVLFAKPRQSGNKYAEVINDTNELLINMYRQAQLHPAEFAKLVNATLHSQSDYERAKKICKNPDDYDEMTRAWAMYVNLNMSFAYKAGHGWRYSFNSRDSSGWHNRKRRLSDILRRLEKVYIGCEDALDFIRRWDSPQTLFYCDPPYPDTNQGHYDGYTMDDFAALCDVLDSAQGSYILSNYAQDIEPVSAQERIEVKARMTASNGKARKHHDTERTEILWVCDRSNGIQREDIARYAEQMRMMI